MTLFCISFSQLWDFMFIQCLSIMSYWFTVWCGMAGQGKRSLSAYSFYFIFKLFVQPVTSGSPPYPPLLLTAILHCFRHIKQCCWSSPPSLTYIIYSLYYLCLIYCLFFFHPLTFMPLSYSKGQHSLHILLLLLLFMMEVEPGCVFQSWRKFSLMFTRNIQTVF